jgi:hypothetical protein
MFAAVCASGRSPAGSVPTATKTEAIARDYKPLDDAGIVEVQKLSDETYKRFTWGSRNTEKEAVDEYTNGQHQYVNPYLYGKLNEPQAVMQKYADDVKLIDSAIDKFALDRDIVVYSGTSARHYADWSVGDVKPIPAYVSTAAKEKFAKTFYNKSKKNGDAIMLEIRVPKGAKGLYIGDNTAYHKRETEFLLGRGQNYRVVERTSGRMTLEVMP